MPTFYDMNTVASPAWWAGATTVLIKRNGVVLPWWNVDSVQKAS